MLKKTERKYYKRILSDVLISETDKDERMLAVLGCSFSLLLLIATIISYIFRAEFEYSTALTFWCGLFFVSTVCANVFEIKDLDFLFKKSIVNEKLETYILLMQQQVELNNIKATSVFSKNGKIYYTHVENFFKNMFYKKEEPLKISDYLKIERNIVDKEEELKEKNKLAYKKYRKFKNNIVEQSLDYLKFKLIAENELNEIKDLEIIIKSLKENSNVEKVYLRNLIIDLKNKKEGLKGISKYLKEINTSINQLKIKRLNLLESKYYKTNDCNALGSIEEELFHIVSKNKAVKNTEEMFN